MYSLLLGQPFVFVVKMSFQYDGKCQYALMQRGGMEVKVKCAELREFIDEESSGEV